MRRVFVVIFLLCALLLLFVNAVMRPGVGWDTLGYIGSAYSLKTSDKNEIHRLVYGDLRDEVPAGTFGQLVGGNPRRSIVARDPEAFNQQLPFYKIRIVYNALILILIQAGIKAVTAANIANALPAVLGIGGIVFTLWGRVDGFALVMALYLTAIAGAKEVSRGAGPDGLAFLCFAGFIHFYLHRKHVALLAALPVFVAVRTDLLVLALLGYAVLWLRQVDRRWIIGSGLASLAVYFAVSRYAGSYGYAELYRYSFITPDSAVNAYPALVHAHLGLSEFFRGLVHGIPGLISDQYFLLYSALVLLGAYLLARRPGRFSLNDDAAVLLAISAVYVGIHFVLFPDGAVRFLIGAYSMAVVALVLMLRESGPAGERPGMPAKGGASGGAKVGLP